MLFSKKQTVTYEIVVEGMMCQHCVSHVKTALEGVKGVRSAEVDLDEKKATVVTVSDLAPLMDAINSAGYTAGDAKKI